MAKEGLVPSSTPEARSWHASEVPQLFQELKVDPKKGLSGAEAAERLKRSGPNTVDTKRPPTFLQELAEEATEPMILLLLAIGVIYSITGELIDAVTIFAVIAALIGVEAYNDYRAGKTIRALRTLSEPTAPVLRDGTATEVPATALVPGDIVLLIAGRKVPADIRILESYGITVNESLLTGESTPVDKDANARLAEKTALGDRANMAYMGSIVIRGRGAGLVVATGLNTELGLIASLARGQKPPRTPLQLAMKDLTKWMVWVALAFSILVPLLGFLLNGQDPRTMLLTGLSLAFATIPEELPIIITMVLALGGYRLSRQHAIVKKLQAVETLGAVTVIATDKTGTLTENHMTLARTFPEDMARDMLIIGALCNESIETDGHIAGDPMEEALLEAARKSNIDLAALRRERSLLKEFTFDNTRKLMSTVHATAAGPWIAVKGAPEQVLARSVSVRTRSGVRLLTDAERDRVSAEAERMAGAGLRVLAFAERSGGTKDMSQEEAEKGLTFVGLAGFEDPPRPAVADAIAAAKRAGIRTVMITGDHPLTARAIAKKVGLDEGQKVLVGKDIDALSKEDLIRAVGSVSIFARTSPENKLRIVEAFRARGDRIAVTGDGINDAPALAAADIGVAMGETGSDVAREQADMILTDDNFTTIERAIKEGRKLFANLSKGVRYYLTCKVALISIMLLAVIMRVDVPFSPIQIILLELFMDLGASAAFAAEVAESDIMDRPPRDPKRKFLDRPMVISIFGSMIGLFLAVSVVYSITLNSYHDLPRAQTAAFVTWLFGHFMLALNMRSDRDPILKVGIGTNRTMLVWGLSAMAFAVAVVALPFLHDAVKTTYLSGNDWLLVIVAALLAGFWIEVSKLITYRPRRMENITPAEQ
jgi:Ca2+-transporting ATPase